MTEADRAPDLEIDGIKWFRLPGIKYGTDYCSYLEEARKIGMTNEAALAELFKYSLWFLIAFGLRVPMSLCNQPWWIERCKEVQNGPNTMTLDLWHRESGKSTIITVAKTIQDVLNNPEERVGIFSYTKPLATNFLRSIKLALENSGLLKACFPDVLYQDPRTEADKWSETDGLIVKRKSYAKEATFSAHSLQSNQVGSHFSLMIFDDCVVPESVATPELIQKTKEEFDMAQNLSAVAPDGTRGRIRVIGTHYHHEDLYMELRNRKFQDGTSMYNVRIKPATVDGTPNGASAYLPETRLAELRLTRHFYSQQLLNPTPQGAQKLDYQLLREVTPAEIPPRLFRFMAIDPAGERKSDNRQGDSWALVVAGVEPFRDDLGASRVFILDMMVEPMTEAEALDNIVKMFLRNGQIRQLGVEKVGISTAEVHIAKALHARGRAITLENKGLVVLRPAGRSKEQRIEAALQWPLLHGKLHISTAVPSAYRERLRIEMERFPYWHDDALDGVSYIYDMVRDFRFGKEVIETEEDRWAKRLREASEKGKPDSWLYV